MKKVMMAMAALSAAIFSAIKEGINDISGSKEHRTAAAFGANGVYMPTRSQRVKNKIRARQKAS